MSVHQAPGPGQGNLAIWATWGDRYQRVAVVPDPDYWDTADCGCPLGIIADEGHQEGCEHH